MKSIFTQWLVYVEHKQICWLLNFICRYIPLKQWVFDDSHSPKYQKFKIDQLPKIIHCWLTRKTANTLLSTNVWIPNALIIFTTSKKSVMKTLLKTMAKTNISSTTSPRGSDSYRTEPHRAGSYIQCTRSGHACPSSAPVRKPQVQSGCSCHIPDYRTVHQ